MDDPLDIQEGKRKSVNDGDEIDVVEHKIEIDNWSCIN